MQRVSKKKYHIMPSKPFWYKEIFRIGILAVISSIAVILISIQLSTFSNNTSIRDIGVIFGVLLGVIPLTIRQIREVHRRDSIDRNLPLFLLALVSAVQSGSNLIRAIEQAADRNLGALSPEIKNLRANISWGMPIEEAFENFATRTGTRVARRVTVLLEMAMKIGGDVTANLEMIQRHVTEIQNIEKGRKSALQPYTYTIYISFAVFLAVAVLLTTSFFSEIEHVQKELIKTPNTGKASSGIFSSLKDMDVKQLRTTLFNMAIIEAVFGGLAAGKIGSGSYVAGIKHTVVMIIISVIAFYVV